MTQPDWTPYGIIGFRRRWHPNWRALGWLALNTALWAGIVYGVSRWAL